ncbi:MULTISPECIES: AAA family ATPase [unclassified Paraburkholderia]|uniref:AAA family ATPase n=1 Tax=unclassified Paraburkholderia TaxID=2615204 RepID=UPI002AB0E7F8|nr:MULTISPECIES: AAA family ATPase [unclassified Paraburkholderia]
MELANAFTAPRIFLLGPHGSGKSSIGRQLVEQGYVHLSIGLIGRLARRRLPVADLPVSLLHVMARHTPGEALESRAAAEILQYARTLPKVVIDGFPGHVEHLGLVGDMPQWQFVYVLTPRSVREGRLELRAATSRRGWTPGGKSPRDALLPVLCRHLRNQDRLLCVSNRIDTVN